MTEKSIIIIGAGLAGLSTGCYAQMNGYRSHIFEHHTKPGGVVTGWKRNGFTIDYAPHFLMYHKPGQPIHKLYCELGTAQANRFICMTTYARFIDENSGRRVDITQDLDRLANELKACSPDDARIIDEFIAGARAMQESSIGEMSMSKPFELMGLLDWLKQMWNMRRVFKYLRGRYAMPVTEYVQAMHDPWLRQVFKNLFLPEVPVWFILMLLGLLADRQIGLLEGGGLDFVLPIEKRYKSLGGHVNYNATIEEILVENDRAVGVLFSDGSEHRADIIVSAADGYSTIFKMLGGRYMDKKIENRYKQWNLIRPMVTISFGIARIFPDVPHLSTILLKSPFTVGSQTIDKISVRILNYSPMFTPSGRTLVQSMFETEWEYWNDLQRNHKRYEAEKERIAAEILGRLETQFPGISSQVEITDVVTPCTIWRYTLNKRGAYMGWLPTPEAIMTPVPRALPGLANFYMAGQWVMPGGGVPPCLYSGRHVVQILCHRDGKPFLTTMP